jgi:NAD-dependent dihydropyrimidine dehydrogenase PreA subunit
VLSLAAVRKWKSESIGVVISVDYDRCEGIGKCVDVCPAGVYELVKGKTTAPNIDGCVQCCACVDACPKRAIKHSSCR